MHTEAEIWSTISDENQYVDASYTGYYRCMYS